MYSCIGITNNLSLNNFGNYSSLFLFYWNSHGARDYKALYER